MAAEQRLDAGEGPAGRRDGKLLAGDLEQQGTVQVHRRQLGHPRPWIEVRPFVNEPRQHRVGVAKVGARLLQPNSAAGILGHGLTPFPAGMPGNIVYAVWFLAMAAWMPSSSTVSPSVNAAMASRSR